MAIPFRQESHPTRVALYLKGDYLLGARGSWGGRHLSTVHSRSRHECMLALLLKEERTAWMSASPIATWGPWGDSVLKAALQIRGYSVSSTAARGLPPIRSWCKSTRSRARSTLSIHGWLICRYRPGGTMRRSRPTTSRACIRWFAVL